MKLSNDELRDALRSIEGKAAAALASQAGDEDNCGRGLRRAIREIGEIAGAFAFVATAAALMYAWAAMTPPQMSAECDLAAEEMEAAR